MPNNDQADLIVAALRDFFVAHTGSDLSRSYQHLAANCQAAAPAVDDWKHVEFAFNRLFVGPRALQAPPYASVYLDPEPRLMGQSTLQVREIYRLLGLTSPWHNSIPDDHISFELDAYRQLNIALARVESEEMQALRQYFLLKHMRAWIFQFVNRVKAADDVPEAILYTVDQLAAWLNQEIATVEAVG